jgi:hypothetical protein
VEVGISVGSIHRILDKDEIISSETKIPPGRREQTRLHWRFSLMFRISSTMNLFQKVNKEMHVKILSHLRDAVRRKHPENGHETAGFFCTMHLHNGCWSKNTLQSTM